MKVLVAKHIIPAWIFVISIFVVSCQTEQRQKIPFTSLELKLENIPLYTGRDAWKNRVFFYLNFTKKDSFPSYAQPFDYYELYSLSEKLRFRNDSLTGILSFQLPQNRDEYSFLIKASVTGDKIEGNYEVLASPLNVKNGSLAGMISRKNLIAPKLKIDHAAPLPKLPKKPDRIYTLRDLRDKGEVFELTKYLPVDKAIEQITESIQRAIDDCHESGGGIVLVPEGSYISGHFQLRSNVVLFLDEGSEIIASDDSTDYPDGRFIYAENTENSGIAGTGTINGNGMAWIDTLRMEYPHRKDGKRLHWSKDDLAFWPTVLFNNCKNVIFYDFEIKNSPSFHLTPLKCDGVDIKGVRLNTPISLVRADGIDLIGSRNVTIRDCIMRTGDDVICLKGQSIWKEFINNLPTAHIRIDNCVLSTSCNGFKTGTESQLDMYDIRFTNSIIYNNSKDDLRAASAISITAVDGGNVFDLLVDSIQIINTHTPIFFRAGKRNRDNPGGNSSISNITIKNVFAKGTDEPIAFHGLPDRIIRNISLENISLEASSNFDDDIPEEVPLKPEVYPNADRFGILPTWGLYARYVDNLTIRNLDLKNDFTDKRDTTLYENVTFQ